jgi:hypothetical protein
MHKHRCEEKIALIVEYQNITQAYFLALGYMAEYSLSNVASERVSAAVEEARQASASARERLDHHVAEHDC